MVHANARLTVHGRLLIVQRYRAGWRQAHLAAAMGVSRKCVKTWIDRYRDEGEAGLEDRSSRPRSSPTRTSPERESAVLQARREHRWGQDRIGPELGIPPRTVSRILRRNRMPYLTELDRMTGERIRASKATTIRYERARPGELVHMDVKKLGAIREGGGWRGRGGTRANHDSATGRQKRERVGYDFVHSLVDDHSRLAYSEVLTDEKGATCAGFLTRAAAFFASAGIPRIERVMTDNAWAYQHSLKAVIADLGARQKFIKPHCPWQNGKVERFNRTLATEWAYARAFTSSADRTTALAPWLEHYNNQRAHTALGGHPPTHRLQPTS